MAKSRGRKSRKQPKARSVSGDPRRQAAAECARDEVAPEWFALVSAMLNADLSAPETLPLLPALYLNWSASRYPDMPSERCVDDCLVLAHACAQFGIEAQVRAVQLTVSDVATGAQETHGSLPPQWEDGLLHGHTVVWLPQQRLLIDPTAEQYDGIDAYREGPVIGRAAAASGDWAEDSPSVTVARGFLGLQYLIGSLTDARTALDHPVVLDQGDDHIRFGVNVASEVGSWLSGQRPEKDIESIPYPRAAALVRALWDMDKQRDESGDVVFSQRGRESPDSTPIRLNEIQLPAGIPPVTPVN